MVSEIAKIHHLGIRWLDLGSLDTSSVQSACDSGSSLLDRLHFGNNCCMLPCATAQNVGAPPCSRIHYKTTAAMRDEGEVWYTAASPTPGQYKSRTWAQSPWYLSGNCDIRMWSVWEGLLTLTVVIRRHSCLYLCLGLNERHPVWHALRWRWLLRPDPYLKTFSRTTRSDSAYPSYLRSFWTYASAVLQHSFRRLVSDMKSVCWSCSVSFSICGQLVVFSSLQFGLLIVVSYFPVWMSSTYVRSHPKSLSGAISQFCSHCSALLLRIHLRDLIWDR